MSTRKDESSLNLSRANPTRCDLTLLLLLLLLLNAGGRQTYVDLKDHETAMARFINDCRDPGACVPACVLGFVRFCMWGGVYVCVCVRMCVRVCTRVVCVRFCVSARVCMYLSVSVRACVRVSWLTRTPLLQWLQQPFTTLTFSSSPRWQCTPHLLPLTLSPLPLSLPCFSLCPIQSSFPLGPQPHQNRAFSRFCRSREAFKILTGLSLSSFSLFSSFSRFSRSP